MRITYDQEKRALTLAHRDLDFEDARHVFAARSLQIEDDRIDYGEIRWQTIGRLNDEVVMVVWTSRGDARYIISMRKCNARKREKYRDRLDGPG
jgi:uncharacterized DUF497 family protein